MKNCLFLILLMVAFVSCQENTSNNSDASSVNTGSVTSDNESEENLPKTITKRTNLEKLKSLESGSWYEGKIDKYPIWLFIAKKKEGEIKAYYGYESTNGAAIALVSESSGPNFYFKMDSWKGNEEFELDLDPTNGQLTGMWKNLSKKLKVSLDPVNTIPETSQDFLAHFEEVALPFSFGVTSYSDAFFAKAFKNKNKEVHIPNIQSFIPELSAGVKTRISALTKAQLYCRMPLANNRFLVFLTIEDADKDLWVAAHFDASGKLISATGLGYADQLNEVDVELKSRNKLILKQCKLRENEERSLVLASATISSYKIQPDQLQKEDVREVANLNEMGLKRYERALGNVAQRAIFDGTGLNKGNVFSKLPVYKNLDELMNKNAKPVKDGEELALFWMMHEERYLPVFTKEEIESFGEYYTTEATVIAKANVGRYDLLAVKCLSMKGTEMKIVSWDKNNQKIISEFIYSINASDMYWSVATKIKKLRSNVYELVKETEHFSDGREEVEKTVVRFDPETGSFTTE